MRNSIILIEEIMLLFDQCIYISVKSCEFESFRQWQGEFVDSKRKKEESEKERQTEIDRPFLFN